MEELQEEGLSERASSEKGSLNSKSEKYRNTDELDPEEEADLDKGLPNVMMRIGLLTHLLPRSWPCCRICCPDGYASI